MREAINEEKKDILEYLKSNIYECLYMYIDIKKYDLQKGEITVWIEKKEDKMSFVAMKYHTSLSFFSDLDEFDVSLAIDLITKYAPLSITGSKRVIERIIKVISDNYISEYGYVLNLTEQYACFSDEKIELAKEADVEKIADLVLSEKSIGSYYEREDYINQIKNRMKTSFGRNYVIKDKGIIIGHTCSYAEIDNLAITAALIVDKKYRNKGYGTKLERHIVAKLIDEGFEVYTFVTNKNRKDYLLSKGNICVGFYGKLYRN